MFLYHFTLQKPGAVFQACCGNFSGTKTQEILVGRGNFIELYKPDETGRLQSLVSYNVFGIVRSIVPFRLTGGNKDFAIVGSDSGRIVILEYNPQKNILEKIHQETYGKSGCRRIVPGQYLATDPKGRAVMIGAVEKNKFVYILNRDTNAKLTISSPLEAHKAHSIVHSICGVDVGFENPVFAAIEVLYEEEEGLEAGEKNLVYYELDLGLNHVVRKWYGKVDPRSNLLVTVPGGSDGPGGVLVCAENYIYYRHQGHPEIRRAIPRRRGSPRDQPLLIIAHASHKQKDMFFFLLQSELGDLYKVTLVYEEDVVNDINIKYFDSVSVANSLCLLKNGLLFVGAEFGRHTLYQFQSIGEDEEASMDISDADDDEFVYFVPHPLKNLAQIDELDSLSPILDMKIADLSKEEMPQIYVSCGRGLRSTLRVLRHGLTISEMAVQPLPGNPSAVWTIRKNSREEYDKYIVVSFVNATLVMAIGDVNIEEATDSGFLGTAPTLHAANIGDDSFLQVHPNGIRHIRADKRIHEWKTPGKKTIAHATSNERQVVIALTGGDILYFELDAMGQLMEIDKKFMGTEVACLDIAPIPEGRQRSKFLAVGDWDKTVRVFSLDPDTTLQSICVQAVPSQPESLAIVHMQTADGSGILYLHIGLNNGVLLRSAMDSVTGDLSDTRTRFIGTRAVKLNKIKLKETNAVMALSSRTWLCYHYQGRFQMTPLSYPPLDFSCNFSSEPCPEGIVAISASSLRIITVDKLGEMFNSTSFPLLHTPRKFLIHPQTNHLIVMETDHHAYTKKERDDRKHVDASALSTEEEQSLGESRAPQGRWASALRLLDPNSNKTLDLIEFDNNEAAVAACTAVFTDKGGEAFLCVGTAKDVTLHPVNASTGFLHVYRVLEGRFELIHKTPIDGFPGALCAFQGRLLVGAGKSLRIYDLGKRKMLRKCENKNFSYHIVSLHTQGDRIYVGDVQDSVQFVKYKRSDNQLYSFADEAIPRWLTSTVVLDYDTVAGADKFGNIFVSRLPAQASDEVEEDPTGAKFRMDQGYLNGAPHKLENLAVFYAGDTVTSLQKASITPGGSEALIYSTISGSIGALVPFTSREDIDFFSHLEMHLRQEHPPLLGRDHLTFRSYYFPVKGVMDGDLCEQFALMDPGKQNQIASELERSPAEIMKKLEDMRNRLL